MNRPPVKRRYDASRRQAQSRQLSLDVTNTARQLFIERGYAATTISEVADAAGVSSQFVFKALGTKRGLLAKVIDWALAGDDAPVPIAERPEMLAVRRQPSVAGKCALYARNERLLAARFADVLQMLRAAADADPDARAIYAKGETGRHADVARFVKDVAGAGTLRSGITQAQATDAIWALAPAQLWTMLVVHARWTAEQFEQHYAGLIGAAMLDDKDLAAVRRFSEKLIAAGP